MSMSLWDYSRQWEELCAIESDTPEDDPIIKEIAELKADTAEGLTKKVDAWIAILEAADMRAVYLKEKRDAYDVALKTSQKRQDRLEQFIIKVMQAFPTVTFKGERGQFRAQKNGTPRLVTDFLRSSVSVSNALADDVQVPEGLAATKTVRYLDVDALKKKVAAGETFPFAKFEHGYHLRVKV